MIHRSTPGTRQLRAGPALDVLVEASFSEVDPNPRLSCVFICICSGSNCRYTYCQHGLLLTWIISGHCSWGTRVTH